MNELLVRILTGFMPLKKWRRAFRAKYIPAKTVTNSDLANSLNLQNNNHICLISANGTEKCVDFVQGLKIEFYGKNSTVRLHEPISFSNCELRLGDNNLIEIGSTNFCISNFVMPYCMRENSTLLIGKDFSCMECKIFMHDEPDIKVVIGNDCMFSFGVIVWPSDGHTIIDANGNPLNKGKDIILGNHVWAGMNTTILKGANVPDNSVLAAHSLFTNGSNQHPERVLGGGVFAGVPAKQLKSGINWDRKNYYDYSKERIKNKKEKNK